MSSPLERVASAATVQFIPPPNAVHSAPFQRASRLAAWLPAMVNDPPATRSPSGNLSRADTVPFKPVPSADHVEPSQLAMRLALLVPAVVKSPPATTSPLGRTNSD